MLDTKQQILLAIFAEYQKDIPDMKNAITANNLGLPIDVFFVAISKLQNEGLINGAHIVGGRDNSVPAMIATQYIQMTRYGIEYVENKLNINKTLTGLEKLETVGKSFSEQGLTVLSDFVAKVTAEIIKSKMGL